MQAHALDTYQSDAVERPLIRRRLFWALVASVAIHVGVVIWFRQTHLHSFNLNQQPRLVPLRVFNIKPITINEGALNGEDKQEAPKPVVKSSVKPLDIPDEKPMADVNEGKMAPAPPPSMTDLVKPVLGDKPKVDASEVQAILRAQDSAAKVMEQDLDSMKDSLLKDQSAGAPLPKIKLPESGNGTSTRDDAAGMAVASTRLDGLLGKGLHSGDAPVSLPGGALFEFASADLRSAAIEQLHKLGELIQRNPGVIFAIEGYTDSFGDAAYNQELSQQRADSVRLWLIQNMDVNPAHITSTGYGATNFIVAPKPVDMHSQASIEQEKLLEQSNRRVEIRFKFPKAK